VLIFRYPKTEQAQNFHYSTASKRGNDMVSYYLLRDNQESGPYTLAELKAKSLLTTDLIWVNGESKSWQYPSEIPALRSIQLAVKKQPPKKLKKPSVPSNTAQVTADIPDWLSSSANSYLPDSLQEELDTPPSFEALREKYAHKRPQKKVWTPQVNIGANLMGLVTLFIGLGLSAYMVKKAVENMDYYEPEVASAEAIAIEPERLVTSTATHAAFAKEPAKGNGRQLLPDSTAMVLAAATGKAVPAQSLLQPNVTKGEAGKTVTAQRSQSGPKKEDRAAQQPDMLATMDANKAESTSVNKTNVVAAATEAAGTGETNVEDGNATKTESKPTLRLSANKYSVGFLGGISNLALSVSNPSAQEVTKAVVEVEYLRPNGKVVSTQTITVSGIAPGGSKTVPVPDNSRGVSVRYKVIKVEG
jgi:hypothetical protein